VAEPVLAVRDLAKGFGGIRAVDGVSFDLHARGVHAVIGPNGAGKTTLINLLSGDLVPSAGSIRLSGREIAGLPPERIARFGVGRSYQRVNIFPELSAFANCRLAAQARLCRGLSVWRRAADAAVADAAEAVLAQVGLQFPERTATALSHGEQRQLEIAMTLAMSPKVLLLDEPLAGMGPEEAERMTALIGRLGRDHVVLLVEHDMDAVFSIADTLTVMVDGRILETGAPAAIRASAAVQDAYLGSEQPG
jgi:branched-chain amino acid transport system ATP-binding protein